MYIWVMHNPHIIYDFVQDIANDRSFVLKPISYNRSLLALAFGACI